MLAAAIYVKRNDYLVENGQGIAVSKKKIHE